MTEERRKYLASISKEEQHIRFLINLGKLQIKNTKCCINEDNEYNKEILKVELSVWKTNIKALKKQLPAPTISLINYHCNCPKCKFFVDGENDNYCYNCGQKLR